MIGIKLALGWFRITGAAYALVSGRRRYLKVVPDQYWYAAISTSAGSQLVLSRVAAQT